MLIVFARHVLLSGTISSNGGNGDDGVAIVITTGDGMASGGGSGNPGVVIIICEDIDNVSNVTIVPGTPGSGVGGGESGFAAGGSGYKRVVDKTGQIFP